MLVKQVILFCNYSSNKTRRYLQLSELKIDNAIRRFLGLPELKYQDVAPWIEAFIKYFQTRDEYSLHVVALHVGMRKESESFALDGIKYHYIKSGLGFCGKILDKLFHVQQKKGFPAYQRRFKQAIKGITLDWVLMCGAENPDYASLFLKSDCPHKLVILQTLLNDPKRIAMEVSTDFRRRVENDVFKKCKHFAVPDEQWIPYVKTVNPTANCYSFTFPTIAPTVNIEIKKQYDFVFFAGGLARNKGTNDAVSALSIVAKKYPYVTLNLIGGASEEYMNGLYQQIKNNRVERNVIITPSFPVRNDVFNQVVKSSNAVLPGITASLNSTVREAMLMGMPTIVYETPDTIQINQAKQCILTAKMEDVEDLAEKMEYALIHTTETKTIAQAGEEYAKNHFSQEAFNHCFDSILKRCLDR